MMKEIFQNHYDDVAAASADGDCMIYWKLEKFFVAAVVLIVGSVPLKASVMLGSVPLIVSEFGDFGPWHE